MGLGQLWLAEVGATLGDATRQDLTDSGRAQAWCVDQNWEDPEEVRRRALEVIAALEGVEMDFSGSEKAWRYGGGRDLSRLAERARQVRDGQADVEGPDNLRA